MEIRIYRSHDDLRNGKHFYCARIESPDVFDYNKTRDVFTMIYGTGIIFVVIAL